MKGCALLIICAVTFVAAVDDTQVMPLNDAPVKALVERATTLEVNARTKAEQARAALAMAKTQRIVAENTYEAARNAPAGAQLASLVEESKKAMAELAAHPAAAEALNNVMALRGKVAAMKTKVVKEGSTVKENIYEVPKEEAALRNMTPTQIDYWANKEMEWETEAPLSKNELMGKIFDVKNHEADQVDHVSQLKLGINMDPDSFESKQYLKGETVIINGHLVHKNDMAHGPTRDPQSGADDEPMSPAALQEQMDLAVAKGTKDLDEARRAKVVKVKGPINLEGVVDESEKSEESESLGEDANAEASDDEASAATEEREDDDELADDNDESEVEDESTVDDAGDN